MKARIIPLLRWHFIFCVFYYQVQELLEERSLESLHRVLEPTNLILALLGFGVMFAYAVMPYLVLRKYYGRPWHVMVLALLAGSVLSVSFRYLMEEVIAPEVIGFRNYPVGTSFLTYYLDNLFYVMLHGAIGVIVFLLQMTRYRELQKQALEIENQRTELAFLRAQINPHFLFNTLNNVYSLFFQRSDKALKVIERLTVMLRYGLYEKAEKVPLTKEIQHLVNFIELEKLRYDFEPNLDLQLPVQDTEVLVPPLLLITFVENAFKHGDLRQPLTIKLTINENRLEYEVCNLVKRAERDAVGGIGLDNLRKRLELLYPERHKLTLDGTATTFTARLSIDKI